LLNSYTFGLVLVTAINCQSKVSFQVQIINGAR
jgi:hypothetical protein